jgi:hypothetical protein
MHEVSCTDRKGLATHFDFQLSFHEIKAFILAMMDVHRRSTARRYQALDDKAGVTTGFPCDEESIAVTALAPEGFTRV